MKNALHTNTFAFDWPVRVYYEDTDAGGVVYHSTYLNFMERARTEWLRQLGFEQDQLNSGLGVLFVVRNIQIDYLKPARFNELLTVRTSLCGLERASIHFQQDILRTPNDGSTAEHLIAATVRVVCIDAERFRPKAIPPAIKGALSRDH